MKRRTYFRVVAAALVGAALVAGLTAPSAAQFGRTRSSRSSSNRGTSGMTARPTTRPTTQVAATAVTAAHPDWSWYDTSVVQQNIFLRQRGRGSVGRVPTTQSYMPSASTWVLRGIVLEASDRVAFLENERTGATIRVHVGENVGSATIVQVERDYLEIESRGINRTVSIGTQLSGEPAVVGLATTEPAAATGDDSAPAMGATEDGGTTAAGPNAENGAADNGGTPATPLSPEEETLQRLRARRNEELAK